MNQTAQAIKEALLELKRPASAIEIKQAINDRYPNKFKQTTLNAHLYACSANNPKAYRHHKGIPKIIFRRSDGKYELYDVQKHGEFSFSTENNKPKKERSITPTSTTNTNLPYIIIDNQTLNQSKPRNEEELENTVKEHSKLIFGNDSIYFDIKETITTKTEVGSIPDGYAITLADQQWYIVEVELSSHDPYSHILPQITKFLNCIENHDNQHAISYSLYDSICEKTTTKTFMEKVLKNDIYYFLTNIIAKKPNLVIIVDEKTSRLEEACKHLKPEIIELKSFAKNENLHAHLISKHLEVEIHAIKMLNDNFACLLCDFGSFSGDACQIVEHIEQKHGIDYNNQQLEGWDDDSDTKKATVYLSKK